MKPLKSNIYINFRTLNNVFLLPIIDLTVGHGKSRYTFTCLLDTESQKSYFSRDTLNKLNYKESTVE